MGSWKTRIRSFQPMLRRLGPILLILGCALAVIRAVAEPTLLSPGTKAPPFTADARDKGQVQFPGPAYQGKVVVVDFWATWCPPCQASLPHLQSVAKRVKAQGVEFLGVCVSDSRPNFDAWLGKHPALTDITFAYDPAGRNAPGFADTLFKVRGIPATYVIGRDGNIATAWTGYSGEKDRQLEEALRKLGIKVS
ncbi:MAG: TlpA disulfide reductase family protein [Holophaga sp.]